MKTYFQNLTPRNDISANSYYLSLDGVGVLLDAGMDPKFHAFEATPCFQHIHRKPVNAIFVSHSHHDHIGALPLAMRRYPAASVFMSSEATMLAEPLLHNSVNIMKRQRTELGIEEYPLFHHAELKGYSERWSPCQLQKEYPIHNSNTSSKKASPIRFSLHHAGHILGSTAIQLKTPSHNILYTGDINFRDQTLLKKANLPEKNIDTLIIETTKGTQKTPENYSRKNIEASLIEAIQSVFSRGGSVLIPIFALGKTQELISLLYRAQQEKLLPDEKMYIGGLSRVFSEVYDRTASGETRYHPELKILEEITPEILNWKKTKKFRSKAGHLYLISSGMMTENTTSNRLASYFLSRKENAVFFVGYTDPDTPGGKLKAAEPGSRVTINPQYGDQPVLCDVQSFDFTSHAIREDILAYIKKLSPKNCILVHGEPESLHWFESNLAQQAPHIRTIIPEPGAEIALEA